MPLLADSWESLIAFVVILVLSGLSNWLRRRKGLPTEAGEEEAPIPPPLRPLRREPGPEPPAPETAPPEPPFDLERELRRLFGEEPAPPPPPPPTPPSVVTAPPPSPPPRPAPVESVSVESLEVRPAPVRELATLAEAEAVYQRASALDELALAKLEAARARAEAAKALAAQRRAEAAARLRGRSPEVEALLTALRSPHTARQALLATFVFGPPKALDEPFPAIPGLRR